METGKQVDRFFPSVTEDVFQWAVSTMGVYFEDPLGFCQMLEGFPWLLHISGTMFRQVGFLLRALPALPSIFDLCGSETDSTD